MKYFITLLTLIVALSSCKPNTEHQFIYEFENSQDISKNNIEKTIRTIEKRLNAIGFVSGIEVFDENKFKIKILANELDEKQIDKMLINRGKLEFWHAFKAEDLFYYFNDIDKELMEETQADSVKIPSVLNAIKRIGYGSIIGYINTEDTADVLKVLNENKQLLKPEHRFVKFLFERPGKENTLALHVLKGNRQNKAALTGEVIDLSTQDYGFNNRPVINIEMNKAGAVKWEKITEKAYKEQTQIAIVINDEVYSAPSVNNGPIKVGRSQISGNYTKQEVIELAIILSGGGEIPKLKLVEYTIVEAE